MRTIEPIASCTDGEIGRKRWLRKPPCRQRFVAICIFALTLVALAFRPALCDSQISVPLPASKIVWNPVTKLLYALVPAIGRSRR